jgi:hypothetical protein
MSVISDVIDQLLNKYCACVRYWGKMEIQWDSTSAIYRPKITSDSIRKEEHSH